MKPYDKADYKRQVRFRLMETTSEDEVFDLIEKHGALLDKDEEAVKMFAKRLNTIEALEDEKRKSHGYCMN
jgi:hypothetical protein